MFNIVLLGMASLFTDISSEMVYPILPIYLVTRFGVGPVILGFIEGIAESLASLLKLFSGYFSDRVRSRKPFTILGYAGSALGKLILYIATNWGFVFIGRAIDRFGKGIRTAPRDALIAENAKANSRGAAFGLHRAMDSLGATIGVLLAYILIVFYRGTFRNIFLLSLIPAIIGILFLFLVKEKGKGSEVKNRPKVQLNWRGLDKRLKFFLLFTFIFTLGNSSNQFLLLRAKNVGSPLYQVILFYLVYNIVYALVSYPAAQLSDKIGRKKLLALGYLFYGLVYLGFAMNNSVGNFWFLFGLYGLYNAFTEGAEKALIVDIAPAHLRASAIGLHAAIVGIGLLPASLLAGMLWRAFGAACPFYFGGFVGVFSSVALWLILRGL